MMCFVTPSTPDSWNEVADNFGKRWNFYHAYNLRSVRFKFFKFLKVFIFAAQSPFVTVRSSCGARTIDITPYGDPYAPHCLRTGAVRLVHKRRMTESGNFLRAPHGVSRYVTAQATVAVESYDV